MKASIAIACLLACTGSAIGAQTGAPAADADANAAARRDATFERLMKRGRASSATSPRASLPCRFTWRRPSRSWSSAPSTCST